MDGLVFPRWGLFSGELSEDFLSGRRLQRSVKGGYNLTTPCVFCFKNYTRKNEHGTSTNSPLKRKINIQSCTLGGFMLHGIFWGAKNGHFFGSQVDGCKLVTTCWNTCRKVTCFIPSLILSFKLAMPSPTKAYNPAFELNFILLKRGFGVVEFFSVDASWCRGFSGSRVKKTWHSNTWEHQHSEDLCRKAYGENCQDKTIAKIDEDAWIITWSWLKPCWTTESCSSICYFHTRYQHLPK